MHSVYGKKLSRSSNERTGLRRNLMKSLIVHGNIKTTKAKAQAVRSEVERLITKAKKNTDATRRQILATLADRKIVDQLMEMSKTQFTARNSGYTRIVKLGVRNGDSSEMVLLSFVDEKVVTEVVKPAAKATADKGKKKEEVKTEKKVEKTESKEKTEKTEVKKEKKPAKK